MAGIKEVIDELKKANTKIIESVSEPAESKPYENYHSCRLSNPGQFDRFARKNCYKKSDGKCVDYIFGIKEGKSEVQSMRYKKSVWDAGAAGSHCKKHGGSFEAAG